MPTLQEFRQNIHLPPKPDFDSLHFDSPLSMNGFSRNAFKGRIFNLINTPMEIGYSILTTFDITVLAVHRTGKAIFTTGFFLLSLTFDVLTAQPINQMTKELGRDALGGFGSAGLTFVIIGMNLIKSIDAIAFSIFGIILPGLGKFGRETFILHNFALEHIGITPPLDYYENDDSSYSRNSSSSGGSGGGGYSYRSPPPRTGGTGGTGGTGRTSGTGGTGRTGGTSGAGRTGGTSGAGRRSYAGGGTSGTGGYAPPPPPGSGPRVLPDAPFNDRMPNFMNDLRAAGAGACTDPEHGARYNAAKARIIAADRDGGSTSEQKAAAVLGITPPYTKGKALRAYKDNIISAHPDKFPNCAKLNAEAVAMFKILTAAKDEILRKKT